MDKLNTITPMNLINIKLDKRSQAEIYKTLIKLSGIEIKEELL